ncbi:hypothetical protein DE146DRAFT_612108, partial [Phaeosphaeria sp. MPI-PUGE-AT-0046c]
PRDNSLSTPPTSVSGTTRVHDLPRVRRNITNDTRQEKGMDCVNTRNMAFFWNSGLPHVKESRDIVSVRYQL